MITNTLKLRKIGVDSRNEHMIFMRSDCPVCRSEGFEALNRIRITYKEKSLVASLIIMDEPGQLKEHDIGLSNKAIEYLGADEGEHLSLHHLPSLDSMNEIRSKIYGHSLKGNAYRKIINDIVNRNLSNIQLSAFLTACAGERLSMDEVIHLTKSMIEVGFRLNWNKNEVFDKHCIGGLPGNRTTPIVVSIIAAAGLTIPKTSSRAITSPAGTADTMETLTNVNLSVEQMKKVVNEEGGCLAWGGSMQLSPADDIIIRVEKALDIDSEGQMIASVLSKKAAAGSTHVVIDIPVGPTAKVRTEEAARLLVGKMKNVGIAVGLNIEVVITDGSQPVGRGIGPALEAKDVLAVLQNKDDAPADLRKRALTLAGKLLEMAGNAEKGEGSNAAAAILESGWAWKKFQLICEKQGGLKIPPDALHIHKVEAEHSGIVTSIDNRKIARLAKLAGAPGSPAAGINFLSPLNTVMKVGQVMMEIHSSSEGELEYALEYLRLNDDIILVT